MTDFLCCQGRVDLSEDPCPECCCDFGHKAGCRLGHSESLHIVIDAQKSQIQFWQEKAELERHLRVLAEDRLNQLQDKLRSLQIHYESLRAEVDQ